MKNFSEKITKRHPAFSLLETLAALVIAAGVLTVLLMLYDRARSSALAITQSLDQHQLPAEILQRIAEDLDRLASPGADTTITLNNKLDQGYRTAHLIILNQIYDGKNKPQTFEKITWQTSYDAETDSLVLYRAHSGLSLEDKLLDTQFAETPSREIFIPLCAGITFFKVQALQANKPLDRWTSTTLPKAVVASISFAAPFEAVGGGLDVPEEEKTTRTIAIDRTRKIKFNVVLKKPKALSLDRKKQNAATSP